ETGAGVDLTPAMHWPAPITTREIEHDRGPVLVTVEYRIDSKDRDAFLIALGKLARAPARRGLCMAGLRRYRRGRPGRRDVPGGLVWRASAPAWTGDAGRTGAARVG